MDFPWKRAESELDREIADHLRQLTAEYERQGYAPEEAKGLAKREFGGGEQIKERCRDERRFAWANGLKQDVVFGWRMLRRTPVVTAAAVLSLALAIGASTAIVSIMDVVMRHDLPLPDPQQIVNVNCAAMAFPARWPTALRVARIAIKAGTSPISFPITPSGSFSSPWQAKLRLRPLPTSKMRA